MKLVLAKSPGHIPLGLAALVVFRPAMRVEADPCSNSKATENVAISAVMQTLHPIRSYCRGSLESLPHDEPNDGDERHIVDAPYVAKSDTQVAHAKIRACVWEIGYMDEEKGISAEADRRHGNLPKLFSGCRPNPFPYRADNSGGWRRAVCRTTDRVRAPMAVGVLAIRAQFMRPAPRDGVADRLAAYTPHGASVTGCTEKRSSFAPTARAASKPFHAFSGCGQGANDVSCPGTRTMCFVRGRKCEWQAC